MKRFKVFFLYSNWKWTGPAEPALSFAESLSQKGVEVHFFSASPPKGDPPILRKKVEEASAKSGIIPRTELSLSKHIRYGKNWKDSRKLAQLVREERPHLIHTHLTNDHLIAALAKTGLPIVRSFFESQWPYLRTKFLLSRSTSHIFTIGSIYQEELTKKFGFPSEKITLLHTGVHHSRFSPERELPPMRERFGFSKEDIVVGMVARIQPHRRFEIFLQAFQNLAPQFPHLKALIVGRGTHIQEVAIEPVKKAGLSSRFMFSGFLEGDEYVGALKAMDILVFMVPGRDGSCRAVREAMAMGLPVLAGNQGILPELVNKANGGNIFEYRSESLENEMRKWILDKELRVRAGRKNREFALKNFSYSKESEKILEVYKECINHG